MAEAAAFFFELREVVEALAKKQGLTAGRWTVGFEFGFAATIAGPTADLLRPAAVVQLNKLTLVAAEQNTPEHMVFDFAKMPESAPPAQAPKRRGRRMI